MCVWGGNDSKLPLKHKDKLQNQSWIDLVFSVKTLYPRHKGNNRRHLVMCVKDPTDLGDPEVDSSPIESQQGVGRLTMRNHSLRLCM